MISPLEIAGFLSKLYAFRFNLAGQAGFIAQLSDSDEKTIGKPIGN